MTGPYVLQCANNGVPHQVDLEGIVRERPCTLDGEIGGSDEYAIASYARQSAAKPVAALLVGRTAPPGKRMGHAGAIISGGSGKASDKIAALEAAGIRVAKSPADMGLSLQLALKG